MTTATTPVSAAARVAGKIALVVGSGSGIGRAAAQLLAQHGASVLCADSKTQAANDTARAILDAGGVAQACELDVTVEAAWLTAMRQVLADYGRLHILVNSAGISFAEPVWAMSLEQWRHVLAVNLDGAFLGTKHAIQAMRHSGERGSIINVSSASGIKAAPGASAYSSSKAAVCMLSRTAALECRRNGDSIRVNTVVPAGVKTSLWREMPFFRDLVEKTGSEDSAFQALAAVEPHSRFAEPEEIAMAILYLASDESLFVTGSDLVIDNGFTV